TGSIGPCRAPVGRRRRDTNMRWPMTPHGGGSSCSGALALTVVKQFHSGTSGNGMAAHGLYGSPRVHLHGMGMRWPTTRCGNALLSSGEMGRTRSFYEPTIWG